MLKMRIKKNYQAGHKIFNLALDFDIEKDFSRIVFFGPSGSGKTLALQSIAGLQKPQCGLIEIANRCLYSSEHKIFVPPQNRRAGYLPQDYALFPHFSILQNVAYPRTGMFPRIISKREQLKARALLSRFGIAHVESHLPGEISGGQKQRAALARALNSNPDFLLLDEPFSALDPLMRAHMREEILDFLKETNLPAIIITHDPDDVESFTGALVLFQAGKARVITDWPRIRANFENCAAALASLLALKWENPT